MPTGIEKQTARDRALNEQQLVVFKVANEEFGVDINEVKEIIRWEEVTRIPNSPPYIKGVINLRGSIIVVNDLAMKLGMPSKNIDDDTRILVVEVGDNTVGMVVDSATEVLRLPGEKIKEAPSIVTDSIDTNYIEGVGVLDEKRLLTLLDLGKVLESVDYEKIAAAQKTGNDYVKKEKPKDENIEKNKPDKKTEKKESKKDSKTKSDNKKEAEDSKKDDKKKKDKKEDSNSSSKKSSSSSNKSSKKEDDNKKSSKNKK
jgi:purine-binding chemotaxis protein CheW